MKKLLMRVVAVLGWVLAALQAILDVLPVK